MLNHLSLNYVASTASPRRHNAASPASTVPSHQHAYPLTASPRLLALSVSRCTALPDLPAPQLCRLACRPHHDCASTASPRRPADLDCAASPRLCLNCVASPPQRRPANLDCAASSARLPLDYAASPAGLAYASLRSPAGLARPSTASPRLPISAVPSRRP